MSTSVISKTELARQTRQVLSRVRRESPIIVESYGQEEAAILDILDYRLLRATATHLAHPLPVNTPRHNPDLVPRGLNEMEIKEAVEKSGGDVQAAWTSGHSEGLGRKNLSNKGCRITSTLSL